MLFDYDKKKGVSRGKQIFCTQVKKFKHCWRFSSKSSNFSNLIKSKNLFSLQNAEYPGPLVAEHEDDTYWKEPLPG